MSIKRLHINEKIRADELRVLGETGENLGVMSKADALSLAKEKELDLIEISPNANPPVARIMSFDKFRYEEEKKLKKQKAQQKGHDQKQVQISVRSAKNDLELKAARASDFLEKGHPVNVVMVLRGREKRNKDWAKQKLDEFLNDMITVEHKRLSEPRWGGRGMNIQIIKK